MMYVDIDLIRYSILIYPMTLEGRRGTDIFQG